METQKVTTFLLLVTMVFMANFVPFIVGHCQYHASFSSLSKNKLSQGL